MKLHLFFFVLLSDVFMTGSAYADNFVVQNGAPTIAHSLELQRYVQTIARYQPETVALKKRLLKTMAYYKKIHILKTITKEHYVVDCVPFAEQPALIEHADLDEQILTEVRDATKKSVAALKSMGSNFDINPARDCPLGSVGIIRPSKTALTSIDANKKNAPGRDYAPAYIHAGYSYELGANSSDEFVSIQTQASQAYFKGPQNQSVVRANFSDHSLDQFWLTNRTYQQSIPTYSVEFGIIASAYFTNPASTSIFVFASIDNYGNNSCYNVECPNFVQFPNTPVLGAPTNTHIDYIMQVTHTTLSAYLNAPAYYLTLNAHDVSGNNANRSASVLLGYYADSLYPTVNDLPQYFSAGAEVYASEPHNGTQMYGNYMIPYVGYLGALHIAFSTENNNYFPYYTTTGPEPYGLIWHLGQAK